MATEKTWTILHIVFPLLPFVGGGGIRLVMAKGRIGWGTFSAADLSICLVLLGLLVHQSLLRQERLLESYDKTAEIEAKALVFLLQALGYLILFGVIVVLSCVDARYSTQLHAFETIAFITSLYTLKDCLATQRSFKLKASL